LDKTADGSPLYANLSQYTYVLWMTGSYYPPGTPGGTLTAADVTFMKAVLDNGGCVLMGSPTAPTQLQTLDPDFLANYLHASVTGSYQREYFKAPPTTSSGATCFTPVATASSGTLRAHYRGRLTAV